MKLVFSQRESLAVLQRVSWIVYAEVLVDGEVIACTPHQAMHPALHVLHVTSPRILPSYPAAHTLTPPRLPPLSLLPTSPPHVQFIDIRVVGREDEDGETCADGNGNGNGNGNTAQLQVTESATLNIHERIPVSDLEIVVTMRGVISGSGGDGSRRPVIEWSSVQRINADQDVGYELTDANVPSLKMETEGYCVVRALYTTSFPRFFTGVQITMNALGVQRAISEVLEGEEQ